MGLLSFAFLTCFSFHVGSGCQDPMAFVQALQHSRKLFYYAEVIGYNFTLLDIGGGFPGTKNVTLTFEQVYTIIPTVFCISHCKVCNVIFVYYLYIYLG